MNDLPVKTRTNTPDELIQWCRAQFPVGVGDKAADIEHYLKELEQLREEKRATGFQNAYDRGYAVGRLRGQDEAWDAARKIINFNGIPGSELEKLFGTGDCDVIIGGLKAGEAIEKVKEWEESKAIRVGDVVEYDGDIGAVIEVNPPGKMCLVLWSCEKHRAYNIQSGLLKKTGRRVDVESFLRQIGGGSGDD